MWEYSGFVTIPKLGIHQGNDIQLPVCFNSPGSAPSLDPDEIERQAIQAAMDWLSWLRDTAPARQDDYGVPGNVNITSIVRI